jgi:hypothetical protein
MESSSIPSSKPVTGRTSTPWLNKSRRLSNCSFVQAAHSAFGVSSAVQCLSIKDFNVQRSTPNAQRPIQPVRVGRWTLNVERWALVFFSGRVKGAWWPSRSSKPSPVSNGRGRFDSYPLRAFWSCSRPAVSGRRCPWRHNAVTTIEIAEERR